MFPNRTQKDLDGLGLFVDHDRHAHSVHGIVDHAGIGCVAIEAGFGLAIQRYPPIEPFIIQLGLSRRDELRSIVGLDCIPAPAQEPVTQAPTCNVPRISS